MEAQPPAEAPPADPPPLAGAPASGEAADEAAAASEAALAPRIYQLELLELAKQRNVIAFLDTGAGKTFVAVLLIRHRMAEARRAAAEAASAAASAAAGGGAEPALEGGGGAGEEGAAAPGVPQHRVAVFLAPKVALVLQQAEVLRAHLGPGRVAAFVGEMMGAELWEQERWRAAFARNDVLAMTPQILLNLLSHGIVKLAQVQLLIFDECHHARARHPYNRIMQQFYHAEEALLAPRPHIFGMTAAPANVRRAESAGGAGQECMEQRIRTLEANLDARVVTVVNRASVEEVARPPKLKVASYPPPDWEAGPVQALAARLSRARARLQCAGATFELQWLRSLQRQLGFEGVAPSAERVHFDPLVPGFTAARLDQLLGGVEHALGSLGPYCAALCAAEVFASLSRPAPGAAGPGGSAAYAHAQLRGGRGGRAAPDSEHEDDDEEDEEAEGGGRVHPPKPTAARLSEEEAARREAGIVERVMARGFEVAEVQSEQAAAHRSALDVLEGFAALFGGEPFTPHPPPATPAPAPSSAATPASSAAAAGTVPATADCGAASLGAKPQQGQQAEEPQSLAQVLADVRQRVAKGQLLGGQPLAAMRLLLAGVHPLQLQRDVEQQLPPAEAAAAATACATATAAAAVCAAAPAGGELASAVAAGNQAALELQLQAAAGLGGLGVPGFSLVTPKVAALAGQLMSYRPAAAAATAAAVTAAAAAKSGGADGLAGGGAKGGSAGWCGIVFVSQRMAAWALHKLLSTLPCTHGVFRTSAIMGLGPSVGDGAFGFQEQSRILRRFRAGAINLLVSTAVAEEGIDVRSCQLVVRFDPPDTAQSYIQSRGRARMRNSELLFLVQQGRQEEVQMVEHLVQYEEALRREVLLNIERLQAGQLDDELELAAETAELRAALTAAPIYEVPATGAKVSLENAQLLLHTYVSRLPSDQYTQLRPLYRTEQLGLYSFRTRAFLPNNAPLAWADGAVQGGRKLAIAAAALEACRRLHQLGALNNFLLPAVLDDPSARQGRQAASPRAPRTPKQPVAGRKRLAEPDALLANKAHEPLPPVVIQAPGSRLLKGCLKSLLSEGAATLHCYRWQAALPGGAGGDAAADALAAADGADPELAELLGSLQQLALLVPEPLPGRLPTFTLAAPAPASPAAGPADGSSPGGEAAEEPGNSTVPHATAAGGGESASSGGGTISVRLVPAGTLHLPREQLQPALCCSSCLLAHMFARGGFCGAAGKLVAAEPDPEAAASPAVDGDAPSAPAGASPGGGSGGEGAPSTPAAARAPTSTALKGQVDEPAPMQVDGPTDSVSEAAIGAAPAPPAAAAAADSEDAEAAAAASALVRSVLHRVLLLHDKRGLPRPKRSRAEEQAAELAASAAAADEAGFLLLPLLGGAAGASADASTSSGAAASTVDGAVDWAAVQEIAAAASFEGTLLQWMQRSQADGVSQADGKGGEGACPPPRASAAARLGGRLVLTTYNGQAYLCRGVAEGLSLASTFTRAKPDHAARPAKRQRQRLGLEETAGAEGCTSGGSQGPTAMEAEPDAGTAPAQALAAAAGEETEEAATEEAPVVSYEQYYRERWGQQGLAAGQPLLLGARVSRQQLSRGLDLRRPRKRSYELRLEQEDEVHLVPQLAVLHPVPAALWRPLGTLPALMWQLEGTLLAHQLLGQLMPAGLPPEKAPPLELVGAAVTARSALEAADLERLETLGDAFLKFAVSAQLFSAHRQYHEGQLTKRKELVVANVHLADAAVKLGLDRRLRVLPFSLRNLAAPAAVRKSSKVLADAVEALLGAFLVAGGHAAALALLQHLGLLQEWTPPSPSACIQPDSALAIGADSGTISADVNGGGGAAVESDVAAIEAVLGYTFRHRWLVDEALTHCSWSGSGARCYQRLEFLGDAVLDALVTTHFYTAFDGASPSQMHDMRSVAVNATRLAFAAVKHGLQSHVRHQSPRLFAHITDFVAEWGDRVAEELEAAQARAAAGSAIAAAASGGGADGSPAGGEGGGGAASEAVLLAQAEAAVLHRFAFGFLSVRAPKVLSDVVESLVGAVYVDSGGDLEAAWAATQALLAPLVTPTTLPVHPIRKLQELVQRQGVSPRYEEVGREPGAAGRVHVTVSAAGVVLGESLHQDTNFRGGCRLAAEAAVAAWDERGPLVAAAKQAAQAEKAAAVAAAAAETAAAGEKSGAADEEMQAAAA